VEAFDFAVGLGAAGADVAVLDGAERLVELTEAVGPGVVGEHSRHGDAVVGKEGRRPAPERGAGVGPFVGERLAEGQAGVGVDGGVDVGVADSASALFAPAGGGSAVDLVTATGWDLAQLLHVDVDQLAGTGSFIAADRCRGLAVQVREPVEIVAAKHPVDRRGRQAQVDGEAVGAELSTRRCRQILVSSRSDRRVGDRRGRLDRSWRPSAPSSR
jgi:hypothetical protein